MLTNPYGKHIVQRITELRALKQGWLDGAGEDICASACDLAQYVAPLVFNGRPSDKPYVYPSLDGGIWVEVDKPNYTYSIEFLPNNQGLAMSVTYLKDDSDEDRELTLTGLTPDDYVVILDDWIEFL